MFIIININIIISEEAQVFKYAYAASHRERAPQ